MDGMVCPRKDVTNHRVLLWLLSLLIIIFQPLNFHRLLRLPRKFVIFQWRWFQGQTLNEPFLNLVNFQENVELRIFRIRSTIRSVLINTIIAKPQSLWHQLKTWWSSIQTFASIFSFHPSFFNLYFFLPNKTPTGPTIYNVRNEMKWEKRLINYTFDYWTHHH